MRCASSSNVSFSLSGNVLAFSESKKKLTHWKDVGTDFLEFDELIFDVWSELKFPLRHSQKCFAPQGRSFCLTSQSHFLYWLTHSITYHQHWLHWCGRDIFEVQNQCVSKINAKLFPKMKRGVKGRLKLFLKFICFGW